MDAAFPALMFVFGGMGAIYYATSSGNGLLVAILGFISGLGFASLYIDALER